MATLYLLNCAGIDGTTIDNGDGMQVPHCPSGASWVQVESSSFDFDAATWLADPANAAQFGAYFGAGFCIVAVAHLIGKGVRVILSMI